MPFILCIALRQSLSNMPPQFRQRSIEDFCFRFNNRRMMESTAPEFVPVHVDVTAVEVSSDSDSVAMLSTAEEGIQVDTLHSTRGIQGATSIATWTVFLWQRIDTDARIALQACCYFIMSDVRWYHLGLAMWTPAQQRARLLSRSFRSRLGRRGHLSCTAPHCRLAISSDAFEFGFLYSHVAPFQVIAWLSYHRLQPRIALSANVS